MLFLLNTSKNYTAIFLMERLSQTLQKIFFAMQLTKSKKETIPHPVISVTLPEKHKE